MTACHKTVLSVWRDTVLNSSMHVSMRRKRECLSTVNFLLNQTVESEILKKALGSLLMGIDDHVSQNMMYLYS